MYFDYEWFQRDLIEVLIALARESRSAGESR